MAKREVIKAADIEIQGGIDSNNTKVKIHGREGLTVKKCTLCIENGCINEVVLVVVPKELKVKCKAKATIIEEL